MCAYSSTRGAWEQRLSQTARTPSTFRYFLRGTAVVQLEMCVCAWLSGLAWVWVRLIGSYQSVRIGPICHRVFNHFPYLSFFQQWTRESGQMGSNTASHSFTSGLPWSPKSTLKTAILLLIPDLNSSFGHTACTWIVTSEEINPFIKNAWPGLTYCLAL